MTLTGSLGIAVKTSLSKRMWEEREEKSKKQCVLGVHLNCRQSLSYWIWNFQHQKNVLRWTFVLNETDSFLSRTYISSSILYHERKRDQVWKYLRISFFGQQVWKGIKCHWNRTVQHFPWVHIKLIFHLKMKISHHQNFLCNTRNNSNTF